MLAERAGYASLVVRVSGLNVHVVDHTEETSLFIAHLLVKSATLSQPTVVMDIGRLVIAHRAPVCLERLLDDLMAHEGDVEPAFGLE